jgi:hypothetical protein
MEKIAHRMSVENIMNSHRRAKVAANKSQQKKDLHARDPGAGPESGRVRPRTGLPVNRRDYEFCEKGANCSPDFR